jgi:uncharacterized protein
VGTSFQWNYTTFLNILFLAVFAVLYWLHRNRARLGGGRGYATDPVCGMQVQVANAPAQTFDGGHAYYFCSDHCCDKFRGDPDRYSRSSTGPDPESGVPVEIVTPRSDS